MKWIKTRNYFLKEAKIKDVILPKQAAQVKSQWGEKWLDAEEIEPTEKIIQGVWKLSNEDKKKALGTFFENDMDEVYKVFAELPEKFTEILTKSIKVDLLPEEKIKKFGSVLANFDIKDPSLDEIFLLYENIFRKLAVGETKATEVMQRDERGRPVMGEDGKPIKIQKEAGEAIFTNNLININSFITDFNSCYPETPVASDAIYAFTSGPVFNMRNAAGEDFSGGSYKIDFELFKKDLYLSIQHNPKDILNMSISKFYASCQHLYTGMYRNRVLGNVFDPNTIPAFLKFDTPIYWGEDKISEYVPLCRMMIRNLEGFGEAEKKIFFDRCYPDRMKNVMDEIVTKYSQNIQTQKNYDRSYLFTPDVSDSDELDEPYMDKLGLRRGQYIGKNTKSLFIKIGQDWSNLVVSPKAKIKELIIETVDIPINLMSLSFDLEWVKFKYIKINSLSDFKFKSDSIGFEKCKFNQNVLNQVKTKNTELSKLQLVGCDVLGLDLSIFEKLDELELVYCLEEEDKLENIIKGLKLKKLIISGDLMSVPENKKYISSLRKSGVKVEIKGLVL